MQEWLTPAGFAAAASAVTLMINRLVVVRPQARKLNSDGAATLVNSANEFIGGLSDRVDYLSLMVENLEKRSRKQDSLIRAHLRWDDKVVSEIIKLGGDKDVLGEPPPLDVD